MNSISYYKNFDPSTSVLRLFGLRTYAQDERGEGGEINFVDCIIELLERVKGIGPSSEAWEATALPLSYTRMMLNLYGIYENDASCIRPCL